MKILQKLTIFKCKKVIKILKKATKFYYFGTKNQKVDLRFFVKVKFFGAKFNEVDLQYNIKIKKKG